MQLPSDVREALSEFIGDVGAGLGLYGRPQAAADYAAALLEREPGVRLSKALGGSRHPRAEAARTLLVKSPWDPVAVAEGLLRRLHTWRKPSSYVWSVQVTALREHLEDDEPRLNLVVISAAFPGLEGVIEVPVMLNLIEREAMPHAEALVSSQVHALDHIRSFSPERRVVSFGAASPVNRFRLHRLGWLYLQLVPPPESRLPMEFIEEGREPISVEALRARLINRGLTGGVGFIGTVSMAGEVPDWPEGVYAYSASDKLVDLRVTNANPYSPDFDLLAIVALAQSYVSGHLDLAGAGLYRGPSPVALMRHLSLVLATTGFIMERLAYGCVWAFERHQLAARRYMDRYLREVPAMGSPLLPGQVQHARSVLDQGEHFDFRSANSE